MKQFGYEICTPAQVYFIIGITVGLVGLFLTSYFVGLNGIYVTISQSICQVLSFLLCTVLLVWICSLGKDKNINDGKENNYGVTIAWVLVSFTILPLALFLSSTLCSISSALSSASSSLSGPSSNK